MVRTAPPVSVRVRVRVSVSFTVLCLQLWRCIFLTCPPIQNASPDPNARIQKFIHYMATPQRRLHRVTIRNHLRGLVAIDGLNQRSECLLNN